MFRPLATRLVAPVLRNCAIAELRICAIAQGCRAVTRLATVAVATVLLAPPAAASDYVETEALFHARAVQEAFDTLAEHIRDGSTAAVSWSGTTPPASTGWLADWTARGLGALYCDHVLLVHAVRPSMKGVGTNLGAVQLAPHLEAKARSRDVPPLHWLESGTAEGVLGRGSVTLPACMGTTPSDRPALAGMVVDPFTVTTNQVTFEHQARACPAGFHGTGQTWVREVTQKLNGRGDPTGSPTTGAWSLLVDHCRADTVTWEYFRQSCTFTPGAPHVGTLTGDAVWRRQKSVTTLGTSYGAPEFVSTTCWTDPNPTPPVPVETTSTTTRTRTVGCGSGYTGNRTQTRTTTWRHLKWPWDAVATKQRVSRTNWATTGSTCKLIPPPPPPPTQQCQQGGKNGGNCNSGNNSGGNNGRDGPGGSWDVDNDGVGDYDSYADIPDHEKANAKAVSRDAVPGHTPSTTNNRPAPGINRGGNQNGGGGNNNGNDPGSNCGGCGREGF